MRNDQYTSLQVQVYKFTNKDYTLLIVMMLLAITASNPTSVGLQIIETIYKD